MTLAVRFIHLAAALTWAGGMLFVAAVAIVLSGLHDFVLGPRAARPDAPPSMRPAAS